MSDDTIRVLVVDDERPIREVYEAYLRTLVRARRAAG